MPDFKIPFSKYSIGDLELFQTIELFQLFRVYTSHPRLLNCTKKPRIHPLPFRNKSFLIFLTMPDFKIPFSRYSIGDLETFQTIELFQIFGVYTRHTKLLNRPKKLRIHPFLFEVNQGLLCLMMPDFKIHFSKYSAGDLEPFKTIELFQLF